MIILDTNVISEALRARPNPAVLDWLDRNAPVGFVLCAPVLAELRYGVERLPVGKRRSDLDRLVTNTETDLFGGQVLAIDRDSAHEFARVVAKRYQIGRPIMPMDAMIAGVALANGMSIATRDINDFTELGIDLIDPFAASVSPK